MKPSERRALEAEKRAREAAEWREKELQRQAKKAEKSEKKSDDYGIEMFDSAGLERFDENGEYISEPEASTTSEENFADENKPRRKERYSGSRSENERGRTTYTERLNEKAEFVKLPEKEIEVKGDGYHRESFFSNHARLIAFIVAATVAIFVVGPLGYDTYLNIRDYLNGGQEVGGKTLTVEGVEALVEMGAYLPWVELDKYEHTKYGDVIEIAIEGTDLTLRAERTKDGKYPDYVRLIHYYCGEFIKDIRSAEPEEIEKFFSDHVTEIEKNN